MSDGGTPIEQPSWSWQDPMTFPHYLFFVMGLAIGAAVTGLVWALIAG